MEITALYWGGQLRLEGTKRVIPMMYDSFGGKDSDRIRKTHQ